MNPPPLPFAPAGVPPLDINRVTLRKEQNYFTIVAVISALVWLLIIVLTLGLALFYVLFIALFVWLAHGLLIAHLKAESVRVSEQQLPVLYRTYREVAQKLGLRGEIPPLYVVQAGGLLNAFTTRHSGRNFVVIYSDMLEACGEETAQIRFLLGHEIGHIQRKHLLKKMFLWPGLLVPLLGTAYSRACESSCDRFGALAAQSPAGSAQALLILAGGKIFAQTMDADSFALQYRRDRGFFVSWHELTSGYPTLSQRVYNMLTLDSVREPVGENRHPLAYLFALFAAGGRGGTGTNFLMTIIIISILLSLVLPAIEAAQKRAGDAQGRHSLVPPASALPIPGLQKPRHQPQGQPSVPEAEEQ